jgi:hypothetical protein
MKTAGNLQVLNGMRRKGPFTAGILAIVMAICTSLWGEEQRSSLQGQGEPDRIFWITGEVYNPGEYTFSKGNSVLTALKIAGGVKNSSDGSVMLLRGSVPVHIEISNCFKDPTKWDFTLKDDDILVVGRYWDENSVSPGLVDAVKLGLELPKPIIIPDEEEKEKTVLAKKKSLWKRFSAWITDGKTWGGR